MKASNLLDNRKRARREDSFQSVVIRKTAELSKPTLSDIKYGAQDKAGQIRPITTEST